jgi:hypothetical protein
VSHVFRRHTLHLHTRDRLQFADRAIPLKNLATHPMSHSPCSGFERINTNPNICESPFTSVKARNEAA